MMIVMVLPYKASRLASDDLAMKVDDLDINDWVIIVPKPHDDQQFVSPFAPVQHPRRDEYDNIAGIPFRVAGKCLPYVMLTRGQEGFVRIDVRDMQELIDIKPAPPEFRRAYNRCIRAAKQQRRQSNASQLAQVERPQGGTTCPKCGQRMRQRKAPGSDWVTICPKCNFARPA